MAYLDVISLAEAKNYLRVDDDLTEDDTLITRMIGTSLFYVEQWTNHILYARAKTYKLISGEVKIYDYPINSLTSPTDATSEVMTLYSNYSYGTDNSDLVLNVGYADPADIPPGLTDVALEIIDILYYSKETGKSITDITVLAKVILNNNKRFVF